MLSDAEIVAKTRELIDERGDLLAVYVFGSTAAGNVRPDSDLDVAFLATEPVPALVFGAAQELAGRAGRDVDLIDLGRASTVLRAQVVGNGRRIHASDPMRVGEFEMYALSDYARLNEERGAAVNSFLARYRG